MTNKVELTCFLYNKKLADLDVVVPDIEALCEIDTTEIEAVRQAMSEKDEDEICGKTCYVYMKSGTSWQVKKSYEEMKKIWKWGTV